MVSTAEQTGAHSSAVDRSGDPVEAMAVFDGPAGLFLPRLLEALCQASQALHAAMLLPQPDARPACVACHPPLLKDHRDQGAWLQRLAQVLGKQTPRESASVPLYNNTGQQVWAQIILTPVAGQGGDAARAVLCLFVDSGESAAGQAAIRHAERAAQVMARYELTQMLRQREGDLAGLTQAMQVLDAVNREARFRPAAMALCNQAADTWRASRVSIGFLAGQSVKLRAMSHTEDILRKMQLVQDLEAAMEECVDQDCEVLVPAVDTATTINRQAQRFADKHGPARLCLLPLRLHGKVVGALAVQWPSDHTITPQEVQSLRLAANLFTARLHQFHLDDRWIGAHLATSLSNWASLVVGPRHTWAKLLAIAGFTFLLLIFLLKGTDSIDAAFTVQTTRRQIITSPFEGTLLRVGDGIEINSPVIGMDQAEQGLTPTVLAELDTSELRVERAALWAQIADYQAQADAARGEGELSKVEVALANVRRLAAQAALYDYRIQRSTLTSPITGVIIEGDLRQRINGSLDQGEALLEIAPLDALRAELLVPASRVGQVRSRMQDPHNPTRGELASASHPGEFIGFTVDRIEPQAQVVNGNNVFRVRVTLDQVTHWMRPGVEGQARLIIGNRSYAYLWTREAINWVRMKLWL